MAILLPVARAGAFLHHSALGPANPEHVLGLDLY